MRELGWDGTADEEEPSPPKPACPGTAPKLAASAVTASTSASASSTASTPVVSSPPQAQASVSTPGGRLHSPVAPPPPPPPAAGRTTAPTPHSLVAQLQLQASQLRNEAMRLRNTGRRPDAIAVLKQLTTVKAQLDQLEQQQRGTVEAPLATSVETTPPAPAKSPTALSLALSAASSITPATTPARPTPPSPPVTPRARTTPPPPATPPQPEAGPAASPAWTKETLLAAYLAATREATANHRMAVARRLLTVAKQIKAQPWDPEHVPPPPTEVAAAAEAEEAGAAASPTAAATTPAPAPASSTTAGRTQSPVSRVSASAASASSSATVADVTPADAPPPGASDLAVSQGLLGQLEKQSAEIEGWLRQCQASGDATTAGALQEALAQDRAAIGIIKAWVWRGRLSQEGAIRWRGGDGIFHCGACPSYAHPLFASSRWPSQEAGCRPTSCFRARLPWSVPSRTLLRTRWRLRLPRVCCAAPNCSASAPNGTRTKTRIFVVAWLVVALAVRRN